MILPHSFTGSSDQSLQSLTLSHTLLLSIHSPFLQRNFLGPSHFVTVVKTQHITMLGMGFFSFRVAVITISM